MTQTKSITQQMKSSISMLIDKLHGDGMQNDYNDNDEIELQQPPISPIQPRILMSLTDSMQEAINDNIVTIWPTKITIPT